MLSPATKLGPYTIIDVVAIGGMGEVYRAEDARLHRDVAIKVLPAHLAGDRASLERFHREARAVAALSHPNILSIFDVGSEDGVHYAVTELLEGETLRVHLSRRQLAPREALELMLEIADGVAAAHARGIVHRDLKPENIFITRGGHVKVLDFGIARTTGSFAAPDMHGPTEMLPTEPGVIMGTLGYLAPEQADARTPTPAADVFALGCILYEMLSGRLPFERTSYARAMAALIHDDAPPLEVGGDIDALVHRCLEKNPEDRLPDAGALAREIRALLEGERLSRSVRVRKTPRAKWLIAAVAAIVVLAALFAFERYRHRLIDHGYDLRASDIRGDGETKRLMAHGLRADAEGNRPKAIEFLEEAHRRGAPSALPAAFLATFMLSNEQASENWKKTARQKLNGASTYEALLTRYLFIVGVDLDQELALSKSILDLRPDAWRLRLGSAHVLLERREWEAARRELQRIDISKPDDRRLMLVLADRASLGDAEGAERDLRASRIWNRPALRYYTQGRIHWSRGDTRQAAAAFDKSAEEAAAEGLSLEVEARMLGGFARVRMRSWAEAQRMLAIATTRARQLELDHRVFAMSAYAAYAAHRAGDAAERDRKLAAAMSVDPPPGPQASLRLLAIRMGSPVWKTWSKEAIEKDPLMAATAALIRAREAWFAGDVATAKRELSRARAEGIDASADREEAELLAYELGLPHQILPADPPYPNNLRYLAVFELENRASANLPQ